MQLPVVITLQPSRRLALLLLAAHVLSAGLVLAVLLSYAIKLVLLLAVIWSAWRVDKGIRGPRRISRLNLRDDGHLEYVRANEEVGEGHIHPLTTVTPQLTIMLLRQGNRVEPLVVLPDALDTEAFRRLRLWLRWRAAAD